MKNSMEVVKQMANLAKFGQASKLVSGNIEVEYFIPYTRTVWEFRVNGVVTERRYTAKMAAAYWCELHTSKGQ